MPTTTPGGVYVMISVRDLRMVFPNGHEALRSLSFDIDCGEFVCIIGHSGAGTSTLRMGLRWFRQGEPAQHLLLATYEAHGHWLEWWLPADPGALGTVSVDTVEDLSGTDAAGEQPCWYGWTRCSHHTCCFRGG